MLDEKQAIDAAINAMRDADSTSAMKSASESIRFIKSVELNSKAFR